MIKEFIFFLILCSILALPFDLDAQRVRINEVLAVNTNFLDEDGDASDWIELFNPHSQLIDITGWTLSDDPDQIDKWTFPQYQFQPNTYLLMWASGKNRFELTQYSSLVKEGDVFQYVIPDATIDENWMMPTFDDSRWSNGYAGFGYGDNDDSTNLPFGTRSVFMRKRFVVTDITELEAAILDIDYDDSFVAYLNGIEIARSLISGNPPAYNAQATREREAQMYDGGSPERYVFQNPESVMKSGENILAIQVHNVGPNSSDMTLIPFLTGQYKNRPIEGENVPAVLNLSDQRFHTNFKLSAGSETIYLYDQMGSLMDSMQLKGERADISLGRDLTNSENLFFDSPTPGFENVTSAFQGVLDTEILFSHQGGKTSAFDLELSVEDSGGQLRYTTDATLPNGTSKIYEGPVRINSSTVIRARYFKDDYVPSVTDSRAYMVNVNHELPIISLITEPRNLFDTDNGIYVRGRQASNDFPFFGANFWEDWERPVHFSFYETDGTTAEMTNAGIKIFGGWSRGFDQRSFSLFARKEYGQGKFKHRFFPKLDYTSFEALVLRNSGNDWNRTMLRDGVLTSLMEDADLEYQAYRPTVVYVNGQYYGIYNLREKVNEHFISSKTGVDPDSIDILEKNSEIILGSNEEYEELIQYVSINNVSTEQAYQQLSEQIDLENFALYYAAQIYFDNQDWPGNNIKFWKAKNGKWRWILFDTDFGFGIWDQNNYLNNTLAFALESRGPGWPNPPWSTLLFRQLNTNKTFRHVFINQMADAMNSRFLPDRVTKRIDDYKENIRSEISSHFTRWNLPLQNWFNLLQQMRSFGNKRQVTVKSDIQQEYGLEGYHQLTLRNPSFFGGYISVNNRIDVESAFWTGDYFSSVPIELTAIAKPGNVFSHWEGDINSTEATVQLDVNAPKAVTAVFKNVTVPILPIVINEINYKSTKEKDADDWIEIYNNSGLEINMTNWSLKDGDENRYTFPAGYKIPADGFVVVARDLEQFKTVHPEVSAIGDLGFGLSSKGDAISLLDQADILRDKVEFDVENGWPEQANGEGFTLELIDPNVNNSLPENWASINENGSPGRANTMPTSVKDIEITDGITVFPIPTKNHLTINLDLDSSSDIDISIYTMDGAVVKFVAQNRFAEGTHQLKTDLSTIADGVYVLLLRMNGEVYQSSILKQ